MIDLNPVRGHEQAGCRPCLVISDNIYNRGPAEKHIVVPITSKNKRIPYHIELIPPEGGMRLTSYLMCDDIRSVSRGRFDDRLGEVSKAVLRSVRLSLQHCQQCKIAVPF